MEDVHLKLRLCDILEEIDVPEFISDDEIDDQRTILETDNAWGNEISLWLYSEMTKSTICIHTQNPDYYMRIRPDQSKGHTHLLYSGDHYDALVRDDDSESISTTDSTMSSVSRRSAFEGVKTTPLDRIPLTKVAHPKLDQVQLQWKDKIDLSHIIINSDTDAETNQTEALAYG